MAIYYVVLDVQFKIPLILTLEDGSVSKDTVAGYIQEIGATFDNIDELKKAIEKDVLEEGAGSKIIYDHIGVIEEADVQREIYDDPDIRDSLIKNPNLIGFWYKTGKGYYSD